MPHSYPSAVLQMMVNLSLSDYVAVLVSILLMASISIPYFIIEYFANKREQRNPSRLWSASNNPWPAHNPPADHQLTKRERHPKAAGVKTMLLTLYEPKYDFIVGISEISPSTRLGFYSTRPYCRITIHEGWRSTHFIHEVAVHEYAHHVTMTEFDHRFKPHGREFKTIYSILMDAYNSKYDFINPDSRYYLKSDKRIKGIILNTKL